MINVTKTFLPPFEEYTSYLKEIWDRGQITNQGPCVLELEQKLKSYLKIRDISYLSNGTIALQLAIKALKLKGDIITTPFSYVATTSSVVWEGCKPIFVDIDPKTLCINPDLIEDAITKETTAILATHVYGIPCDVNKIEAISKKHNLKVIYDAAHAFGVEYQNKSILNFGDVSTLSFHATKLFHTIEGGGIVATDSEIAKIAEYQRRFGHNGPENFFGVGINGKNSEVHAAMGLCVLPYVRELIKQRERISLEYDYKIDMDKIKRPSISSDVTYNFSYYPVIFESEDVLLKVKKALEVKQIYSRRYFYPSLNLLSYVNYKSAPVSEDVSKRVLCLPLYHELTVEEIEKICNIINQNK